MKLNSNSINFKFGTTLIISGSVLLFMVIYSFIQLPGFERVGEFSDKKNAVVRSAEKLKHNILNSNFLLYQQADRESIWNEDFAQNLQMLQEAAVTKDGDQVDELVAGISSRLKDLRIKQDEIEDNSDHSIDINNYSGIINDSLIDIAGFQPWLNQQLEQNNNTVFTQLKDITSELENDLDAVILLAEKRNDQFSAGFARDLNQLKIVMFSILILSLAGGIVYYFWFKNHLRRSVAAVNKPLTVLSNGDLPEITNYNHDELKPILDEVNVLSANFAKVKDFALDVGSGKFDTEIDVFNQKGEIGRSLTEMRDSLKKIAEEERERNWINEGFAKFGDILRKNGDNLEELSEEIISQLVKYLKANQGGIFILNGEGNEKVLELSACYAYERKKYLSKSISPGEGLVGQCYLEQQKIYLKEIPDNYINITSGLGGARPGNLLIVPLKINEEVYGVIEIASFHQIASYQIDFVEKLAESIASSISSVKINQNTKKLLEESQMAAEQLKAQEEEMRQNMEELAATQEEMKRNQDELVINEAKARLIYENSFDGIIMTNKDGIIEIFNPAIREIIGYNYEEVKGSNVENYLPGVIQNHANYRNNIHEMRVNRKNGGLLQLRVKIEEGKIGDESLLIIFVEDVTEERTAKGKEEENRRILQENEANLLALINSTNDTIFAIDTQYKILMVNKTLIDKYEKSGLDLRIGSNILEVLPENLAAYWKDKYDRALAGEKYNYTEEQEVNGQKKIIEVFLNPIKNKYGEVTGTSVISRDITQHRADTDRLKLQLEELEQTKQQLIRDKEDFEKKIKLPLVLRTYSLLRRNLLS